MVDGATLERRQAREMGRLETLIDAVFAIVLVLLVADAPRPGALDVGDVLEVGEMSAWLAAQVDVLMGAVIGLVMVLTYWVKSNALFGLLDRTNSVHASISILQVFCVLLYLYAVSIGMEVTASPVTLVMQSVGAALIGIAGAGAFWYAGHRRRLVEASVADAEVIQTRTASLAEPTTALLTIPCALINEDLWELSWLTYPLIVKLLDRPVSRLSG